MKTDDLIDLLARGAGPAAPLSLLRHFGPAIAAGALAAVVLACLVIGPIPAAMYATPAPWIKLAYAAALIGAGLWWTWRLSRPLARLKSPQHVVLGVVGLMALLSVASFVALPPELRAAALMGHSWRHCPWNVLALSLPAMWLLLKAMRGLAPSRPRRAGFAAGLVAGAVGALGYAFACLEQAPAFVGLWYSLGILLAGLLGAVLGPRCLRW